LDETLLIFYLWPARRKARAVAIAEALALLVDLQATVSEKGPLSEQGGLFWLLLPSDQLEVARLRLPRLGYTAAVDWLEPVQQLTRWSKSQRRLPEDVLQWHHHWYRRHRLFAEDAEAIREGAPDRRTFLLETSGGEVRPVTGYRGDGGVLSRRGLAVADARVLVNLVAAPAGGLFLDPFAGVGGLVIEALASGYEVMSTDWDPVLKPGLLHLGSRHQVADARHLPFADEAFDAIATEPPYHEEAAPLLVEALVELCRVLKPARRLAVLCATSQANALRQQGNLLGLRVILDAAIDRKGLDVVLLVWLKGEITGVMNTENRG
jgi:SAM-dependent methyltransferase